MKQHYENIYDVPEFKQLVQQKGRFSWVLAILMLIIYFSFILVIAFAPEIFARPIAEGSVISVGIPVGLLVIFSSFFLTGVYVIRANHYFDQKNQQVLREYMNEQQVEL